MPDPALPLLLDEYARTIAAVSTRLRTDVEHAPWRSTAASAMRRRGHDVADELHAAAHAVAHACDDLRAVHRAGEARLDDIRRAGHGRLG